MVGGTAYRADIDGLRAVAVIPVVLGHAGLPAFAGGYVGVDVFFVISGFLITRLVLQHMREERFSLFGFYERRARRILPALFLVTAATLALGALVFMPDMVEELAPAAVATVLFGANLWYWRSGSDYFAATAELDPLVHMWSLGVEEQFYLLHPLLLMMFVPLGARRLSCLIALTCAGSLALATWMTATAPVASFYLLPTRAWELGLGALLAAGAVPPPKSRALAEAVAAAGFALIAAAVMLYDAATPFPGLTALLPCLGAAAIIWTGGGGGATAVSRLLARRPLVTIGLMSYSLYLWHWPVLVFVRLRFGLAVDAAIVAGALAAAFLLAWLSWRFVETPWRRRPPAGPGRRAVWTGAAAGVAILAGSALLLERSGGLPGHASPEVRAIYAAADRGRSLSCAGRPTESLCAIGTAGRGDILLWGDSHAGAALPGIEFALRHAGLGGAAAIRNACPPLLGVKRAADPSPACAEFNDSVLRMLRRSDRFATVILVGRWALSAEGRRPEGDRGAAVVLEDLTGGGAGRDNVTIFASALERTVAALRAAGRRVIIVEGTPEIGWHVPRWLALNRQLGTPLPVRPDRAGVRARNARAAAAIAAAAARPGVARIDLVPRLCPSRCAVQRDGLPLYLDDDHLSRFGAVTVLAPALLPHLRGPRPVRS